MQNKASMLWVLKYLKIEFLDKAHGTLRHTKPFKSDDEAPNLFVLDMKMANGCLSR